MRLRIGWLSPFTRRTGIGTFSKAVTDAMPERHGERAIDLTIIGPLADGMYRTRHRFVDIGSTAPGSGFYGLFDVLVCNIGNNTEHHRQIVDVLRNVPSVVICHDYVYQHYLAAIAHEKGRHFADYVALNAHFGGSEALRTIRHSNVTRGNGLAYAPWDTEFSGAEPLAAPLLKLGSALVVHSAFAETYARAQFQGPVLRLGMPHDQRPSPEPDEGTSPVRRADGRMTMVSFGHVQSTKCIDDVLHALAGSEFLRENLLYVVSGFRGPKDYLDHLREIVDEFGLGACVRFAFDLSDVELARLQAEADAFINLRYPNTEGASVSLIEQLVTGKPVVVLDTGCYAELPDDAVVKVSRPRDVDALRAALVRMLERREDWAEIGRCGRAHALRLDCQGYVGALLDFFDREGGLIRRRAAMTARTLLDTELPVPATEDADDAWLDALVAARRSLDLLDQGNLALDPELVRGLGAERIVDYVQAAILRDGTNYRLHDALRAFFAGRSEHYLPTRIFQIVYEAGVEGDRQAQLCLAEVCPHAAPAFWDVVASLGATVLGTVFHCTFFRAPPPDGLFEGLGDPNDRIPAGVRVADALAQVDPAGIAVERTRYDAALSALKAIGTPDAAETPLESLAIGEAVTVGSVQHGRYLRFAGFHRVESDHAWTRAHRGMIYLRPEVGAKRVVLRGYSVDEAAPAAARTVYGPRPASLEQADLTVDLDQLGTERPADDTLCLSIHSTSCRSPEELGLARDGRRLGFCLTQVSVA